MGTPGPVRSASTLLQRLATPADLPRGERVIVFSPHPDDDVISMGGMLQALFNNGNTVMVAYMTTGERGVSAADIERHQLFLQTLGLAYDDVSEMKIAIRWSEALSAIMVYGMLAENARQLRLPFYTLGGNAPLTEADVAIVSALLDEVQPHHIFVAADLQDPHGTHEQCFLAVQQAAARYAPPLTAWLYRGAWQEWGIDEADVFLPLRPADLEMKILAIKRHRGQMHAPPVAGNDPREFYERAHARNLETGQRLSATTGADVYAAEAFVVMDKTAFVTTPPNKETG